MSDEVIEELEELVTPNGIKKGSKVLYVKDSLKVPAQNGLAKGTLKRGQLYTVEFVFPGAIEQIELVGVEPLFVYDMFQRVG